MSAFRQSPGIRDAFEALATVIKNQQPPLSVQDITSTESAAAARLTLPPATSFQNNPEGSLFSSATAELQHSVTAAVTQARGAHHESQPFSDPRLLPPADPNPAFTQTVHEVLLEKLQQQQSTDPAVELQIHLLQELIVQNKEQRQLQALMRQQVIQLEHQAHLLMQYKGTSSQPVLVSSASPQAAQGRSKAPRVVHPSQLKDTVASQHMANASVHTRHLHDDGHHHVHDDQCQHKDITPAPEDLGRRVQTRSANGVYTPASGAAPVTTDRPLQWLAAAQQRSQIAERVRLQRAAISTLQQTQAAQQTKLTEEAARRREIADAQDHALILEAQRRIEARQRRDPAPVLPTDSHAVGLAPDSIQQQPHLLQPQRQTLRLAQPAQQLHPSSSLQHPISEQPREHKLTIRVKKPAQPSEAELFRQERRIARLTDDKEYLKHGSERCKEEVVSEDERQDVLAELDVQQAAQLLFNPKAKAPRTKQGYLDTSFVARDSESPERYEDGDDDDEDGEDDQENDGDSSSTYRPHSNPSSMSRSRSPDHRPKKFSSAQWEEYQQLKRASTAPPGPAQQPPGSTQQSLTYNISIAEPPEHGDWRDIQYLTTTFRDKHEKYVRRCKGGGHLSVWDCYTITQKECILKQLTLSEGPVRDAAYLESLTDTQLYALLQGALGMEYELEVEKALKAIPFKGKVLEKSDWVTFHTSWTQVLKRVTVEGAVQPRRMAEIFRSSIHDRFAREWLYARKHNTWEEAYDAIVAAILNPKWIKCYADDLAERPMQQQPPPAAPAAPAASPLAPAKHQQQQSAAPKDHKKPDKAQEDTPATPFDPLAFKTKAGKNVNPNFKLSLNDNKANTPCSRCGKIHRFLADLCTALKNAEGDNCPPLTPEEFKRRMTARWNKGYYFSKALDAYKSPSPSDVAAAAANTSQKLARP